MSHSKSRPGSVDQSFPTQQAVREDGTEYESLSSLWRHGKTSRRYHCKVPISLFLGSQIVSRTLPGGLQTLPGLLEAEE